MSREIEINDENFEMRMIKIMKNQNASPQPNQHEKLKEISAPNLRHQSGLR